MRMLGWLVASIYVVAVAVFSASTWSDRNGLFDWQHAGLNMIVCLPCMILTLPILYVVGAAAWNVTDADSGGPMWPVTAAYTLVFTLTAVANVGLVRLLGFLLARAVLRRTVRATAASG
jgi:hypothetical protein